MTMKLISYSIQLLNKKDESIAKRGYRMEGNANPCISTKTLYCFTYVKHLRSPGRSRRRFCIDFEGSLKVAHGVFFYVFYKSVCLFLFVLLLVLSLMYCIELYVV